MNLRWRLPLIIGVTLVFACGESSQFVIAQHIGGCFVEGPNRVVADTYEFVVTGDARVSVHKLDGDTAVGDVEAHIETSGVIHPPGTTRVFRIANEPGLHEDRSAQNATSRRFALAPGSYVFVCDWEAGDLSGRALAGSVDVVP